MATYTVRNGRITVRVRLTNPPMARAKTFATKGEAKAWVAKIEHEHAQQLAGDVPKQPFAALLMRYADTVSNTKRSCDRERLRIAALLRDPLAAVCAQALNETHIAAWRDLRLKLVSAAAVNRDWNLLSNVCHVATDEWHWLKRSPLTKVKRPPEAPARDRLITADELAALQVCMGNDINTSRGRIWYALKFALATGMRAGEICGLRWQDVQGRVARIAMTKNGTPRDVPLFAAARDVLDKMEPLKNDGNTHAWDGLIFGLNPASLDAIFRRCKEQSGVSGFTFHDSRANAITAMVAQGVDVLTLARIVGHRDVRMLQRYYRKSAADIAAMFD